MLNFPYIWKMKIGISGNVRNRRRNITETTPGFAFCIWAVPLPFAEGVEQTLHGFFRRFHSPFKTGSGRSEWFLVLPVLPLSWIIINFMFLLFWFPVWGLAAWAFFILAQ
jgi:hypothetical protein